MNLETDLPWDFANDLDGNAGRALHPVGAGARAAQRLARIRPAGLAPPPRPAAHPGRRRRGTPAPSGRGCPRTRHRPRRSAARPSDPPAPPPAGPLPTPPGRRRPPRGCTTRRLHALVAADLDAAAPTDCTWCASTRSVWLLPTLVVWSCCACTCRRSAPGWSSIASSLKPWPL